MFGFKQKLFTEGTSFIPPYDRHEYTPDFPWLERHEWVLLFVYDEMMLNRNNYDAIRENSFSLATAFTKDSDFVMWKKKLGDASFPIPLRGADRVYNGPGVTSRKLIGMGHGEVRPGIMAPIKGELHAIKPSLFWNKLDKDYFNGLEFVRERVKVLVPYRFQMGSVSVDHNEFVKQITCHMYVGNKNYWIDQLDGGLDFSPVGCFALKEMGEMKHRLYYNYSKLEYETNF